MKRPSILRFTSMLALAAMTASACSSAGSGSQGASSQSPSSQASSAQPSRSPSASSATDGQDMPTTDPALDAFTHQKVTWTPCESNRECADFTVPVDYASPSGATTKIRAIRIKSSREDAPALFVNPGGPGGSGYDLVKDDEDRFNRKDITGAYTVIGFDPRGVGKSDPITCLSDSERDSQRAKPLDGSTPQGLAELHKQAKATGEACKEKSGPVLAHMDTASVAKDMDVMRAALGNPRLNYMGFSYGTYLGSMYATLFPKHVGRLVLDGAVDPSLSDAQINMDQAIGFENAFNEFIKFCGQGSSCPLSSDPATGKKQLADLLEANSVSPKKASDGRIVSSDDLANALILPMYNEGYWPILVQALTRLIKDGDPNGMMTIADVSEERTKDGTYTSNSSFAFSAVNCLDMPLKTSDAEMKKLAAELRSKAPLVGRMVEYSQVSCVEWPVKPSSPAPKIAPSEPVEALVIGTTGDPATPYPWAKALTRILGDKATLLTYTGNGHTAFGGNSTCIDDAVVEYLVNGKMPDANTNCS